MTKVARFLEGMKIKIRVLLDADADEDISMHEQYAAARLVTAGLILAGVPGHVAYPIAVRLVRRMAVFSEAGIEAALLDAEMAGSEAVAEAEE